jgi:hypothetical protein
MIQTRKTCGAVPSVVVMVEPKECMLEPVSLVNRLELYEESLSLAS